MTISDNYLYAYFVVQGKEKAYPFLILPPKDMPGLYIFADGFEGYTPNITYIQKTDNIDKSITDLMKHTNVVKRLGHLLGIFPVLYERDRDDTYADILKGLGNIPECNLLM